MKSNKLLKFGYGNAKLSKAIATFSLPAGWACPGAKTCLAFADRLTGKIIDGKSAEFRCFAATDETRPSVRSARWYNFDLLRKAKTKENMQRLIIESLPRGFNTFRIHVSGDFYSLEYLKAWLGVMLQTPSNKYYAYTKSLNVVKKYLDTDGEWPENFQVVASKGGAFDNLLPELEKAFNSRGLRLGNSTVVLHPEQAEALGLTVDHDDSLAMSGDEFALLIHGTQPKDSEAALAIKRLKAEKVKFSYSVN